MSDPLAPLRDAVIAAARNVVETDGAGATLVASGHMGQLVAERRLAVYALGSALNAYDAVAGRYERQKAKAAKDALTPLRMKPDTRSERWKAAEKRCAEADQKGAFYDKNDLAIIQEEQALWDAAHPTIRCPICGDTYVEPEHCSGCRTDKGRVR